MTDIGTLWWVLITKTHLYNIFLSKTNKLSLDPLLRLHSIGIWVFLSAFSLIPWHPIRCWCCHNQQYSAEQKVHLQSNILEYIKDRSATSMPYTYNILIAAKLFDYKIILQDLGIYGFRSLFLCPQTLNTPSMSSLVIWTRWMTQPYLVQRETNFTIIITLVIGMVLILGEWKQFVYSWRQDF